MNATTKTSLSRCAGAPGSARWEHGYRCHGLWIGTKRLAFVGIGPRGFKHDGKHPYGWSIDVPPYSGGPRPKPPRCEKSSRSRSSAMKPYKAKSLKGAEQMVRNLRRQVAARDQLLDRFDKERRLMAMLAADTPQFDNPLLAAKAMELRNWLLNKPNKD